MTVWQWLDQLDKAAYIFIHAKAYSPSLDWLMLLLRKPETWIPLYAFVLYWIFRYGKKNTWKFIALSLVCFALTNSVSVEVLKPFFARLRPCHEEVLQPILRNIISCGGEYSMPSAHASNHFGLAAFWFLSINYIKGKKWYWLWFWAFIVCYAQVYVGKHYPGDILVGAVFGTLIGYLIFRLFRLRTAPQSIPPR
jgi:undecaprenyl-diphosphatase